MININGILYARLAGKVLAGLTEQSRENQKLLMEQSESPELSGLNLSDPDDAIRARVGQLESGLRWWLDERMSDYTDKQYGKGELRRILENETEVSPICSQETLDEWNRAMLEHDKRMSKYRCES